MQLSPYQLKICGKIASDTFRARLDLHFNDLKPLNFTVSMSIFERSSATRSRTLQNSDRVRSAFPIVLA